ncbi:alpha,alpha-trehalase [Opitutaceae bacterium TAV4]|uniref:trehalase family glycosidase n=1 Tax=Geminisphaera colitermitum TaxID=1148786 RepID=UPI000158D22E|nr:trehalase family glycosidase [Geminisphaera colitermitum]RRJ94681.1 alpha,alpha-trehalase [Opitutaceae bacterium TAV4]RRJ98748.1 alpha,alpha-trehalase [Opitutaceae bacterium TAV3]
MTTLLQQRTPIPATDASAIDDTSWREVEAFIHAHWNNTVRHTPDDSGTLLGLPFPYTVPCRDSTFQEMYYWDTYFASLGLLDSGHASLAVSNARNFFAQIARHGFVPNGNRTFYTNRSQPPYLAALVQAIDVSEKQSQWSECKHTGWTQDAVAALRTEHAFWTTRRATSCGLSRYGHNDDDDGLCEFYPVVAARLGMTQPPRELLPELSHALAEAESGWDFTPRFEHRCEDFCPVDLNSLLHLHELYLSINDNIGNRKFWRGRAMHRRQLIHDFLWNDERGGFFDYDHRHDRRGDSVSAAAFHPLWAGIATPRQAARTVERMLPLLEFPHGLATCAPPEPTCNGSKQKLRQWDFPNGWACLQLIAYRGLARYGYTTQAVRIAQKYLNVVSRGFEETGDLWEKYNVEDGTVSRINEAGYFSDTGDPAPAMMGWTAGVFIDALAFLRKHRTLV